MDRPDKYSDIRLRINELYEEHEHRLGYRRMTLQLQNEGHLINHKTVYRLMKEMGVLSRVKIKKFVTYRGDVGSKAPNILNRDFSATRPNEKWVTDVTEFHLFGRKLYLSPVLDLFNGEIVAYNIEERPVLGLVTKMLDSAFERLGTDDKPLLHSDQGWHYQHKAYRTALEAHGINQSMSRKGNCLDNAAMESFFGILKSELLYLKEFESMEHFIRELIKYIDYYNHRRIKVKLKGMSPVQYRTHSQEVA